MSYATRGGAPASSVNELQDPGQYFGDDRRRLVRKQKGKARDQLRPRGPDYRTKPVANDLLKESGNDNCHLLQNRRAQNPQESL